MNLNVLLMLVSPTNQAKSFNLFNFPKFCISLKLTSISLLNIYMEQLVYA